MDSFRIYYANGTTYGSEDGTWNDAPLDGVLVIVVKDGERTEFHSGNDFYAMLGQDEGEDTVAPTHDLVTLAHEQCPWIKYGVWTTHKNFERIMKRAKQEHGES